MSAYIVALVDVTDWDKYKQYMARTPEAIAKYGGKFIARGGEKVILEGPEDDRRMVLLEFPSMAQVKAFYSSEEYQSAKALREGAATGLFIGLDGV